ncbi:MAG: UDP-N-acetylmuramoyl-L-alanine--D-glutamate ligase [Lysobacterales bacterium]
MKIEQLRGKSVGILGGGLEGRAVLDVLGHANGFDGLTLLDEKPLQPLANVATRSGPLASLQLTNFEVIVRSPGVSIYRPELEAARRAGVTFTSGTSLWLGEGPPAPIIAVTGTKGKSTTTSLIGHLLTSLGQRVLLGGNLGQPVITFLNQPAPDWFVVELSSYQLADLQGQVDFAVLTSLLSDHIDWHGSVETYHQDKLRLLSMSRESVLAHVSDKDAAGIPDGTLWAGDKTGWRVTADGIFLGDKRVAPFAGWELPGRHNLNNLELALATLAVCGVSVDLALPAIGSFQALPHRLQPVLSEPFTCINDSIATTPDATIAALRCFAKRTVVLIVGGVERRQMWSELSAEIASRRDQGWHTHVIVQGQGRVRLMGALSINLSEDRRHLCDNLALATDLAIDLAAELASDTKREVALVFSPGAPSFDQFNNFAERGEAFTRRCLERLAS